MSDKKYLVTGMEIEEIVNSAACAGSAFESIDDIPGDEWLKSHEYEERTCQVEHWGGGVFYLACGHDFCGWSKPKYCPECGVKVVRDEVPEETGDRRSYALLGRRRNV